jgi:hypothetical protein
LGAVGQNEMWCFCVGSCVGKTPLLILRSVGILSSVSVGRVVGPTLAPNGFGLGEGGDFYHKPACLKVGVDAENPNFD